jgi:uncharacterized integral membrane protein
MRVAYVVVAVVAALVTIFTLQNTAATNVRLFVWHVEGLPLAALLLGSLVAGALLVGVPLAIRLAIWRSRARTHEARAGMLQKAMDERNRQFLHPRA